MKLLIIIFSVTCFSSTILAFHALPEKYIPVCKEATGISDQDAEEMQRSKIAKDEENESQRCFVACLLSKAGVMKHGDLKVDYVVQVAKKAFEEDGRSFDEGTYKKGVTECNSIGKSHMS
ncbi:uncharacterized protein [Periplaneta americana]|uniref:uncharacterized protein n=1 Tax=Periplaneta americana TaxID=6978 RepID=UPI0037E7071E